MTVKNRLRDTKTLCYVFFIYIRFWTSSIYWNYIVLTEFYLKVQYPSKIGNAKKGPSTGVNKAGLSGSTLPTSSFVKPCSTVSSKSTTFSSSDVTLSRIIAPPVPRSMSTGISPIQSDGLSVSMDETMSTCDSLKSPDVEYIDDNDMAAVDSIERKTCCKLYISEHVEATGFTF